MNIAQVIWRFLLQLKYLKIYFIVIIFTVVVVLLIKEGMPKSFEDYQSETRVRTGGVVAVRGRFSQRKLFSGEASNALESSDSITVLCYVLLSRARVKTAKVIKETWGSHCDELMFFGGYEHSDVQVTYVNVTEGYENLWGKAKAALIYLSEQPKKFQYYLKADDDTFVIIENLKDFITEKADSLKEPVWFGYKLKHQKMLHGYMSGGAGYVFNEAALARVSKILKEKTKPPREPLDCNVEADYGIEDLELGKCFLTAGVKSIDSTDSSGSERFLPLSYDTFLNGAISSFHWIWNQAWNRVKTGKKCCSDQLISMHNISPGQIKTIYGLLYKINVKNRRKPNRLKS